MTCKEADIVTTALLAWDDELSKEFVDLVNSKNEFLKRRALLEADEKTTWLKFWEQKHSMRLKAQSADMKIRQIVNYKILSWDAQAQAYEKLAKEMINSWENAWATIQLLRMVDDASPKDFEEVAHILFEEWEDITSAMTRIRDNIANAWSTLYEQEKVFQSNLVKQLKKEWKSRKEIVKAVKAAMWDDDELIKKWLTPNNFSKPDDEWTVIKNTFENPEDQMKAWKQYCLGKAIIGWIDWKVLKALNVESSLKNFVWEITAEQIDNINTLEELISRAYTNTKQLVEDWLLRDAFNNKLTQLLSNKKITTKQLDYAKWLIRAVRFAKEWAWFSKIVLYDAVWNQARKMWYEVANSEKFYDNILKTIRDEDFIKKIDDKWMVTMADDSKIAANDLLELIVLATWDRRIPKLLREWAFSNTSILDIATQVALWNSENATKKILQLINKVKEMPNLWDSKELALITLCWRKIQPWAKKGFFDYRKMYQNPGINKETRLKAEFEEKMANANRAEIAVDWLEDLTDKKDIVKILQDNYAWWYIITNDAWWRNNKDFANALDAANAALWEDKQITVLYPRQAQMSNFTMEWWKLIFRSRDSNWFRQIMDKVSLRTLWDAEATRELKALSYEIETWRNWDKVRYMVSKKHTEEDYEHLASDSWQKDNRWNPLSNWQVKKFKDSLVRLWENLENKLLNVFHTSGRLFDTFNPSRYWWQSYKYWDFDVIFTTNSDLMSKSYSASGNAKEVKSIYQAAAERLWLDEYIDTRDIKNSKDIKNAVMNLSDIDIFQKYGGPWAQPRIVEHLEIKEYINEEWVKSYVAFWRDPSDVLEIKKLYKWLKDDEKEYLEQLTKYWKDTRDIDSYFIWENEFLYSDAFRILMDEKKFNRWILVDVLFWLDWISRYVLDYRLPHMSVNDIRLRKQELISSIEETLDDIIGGTSDWVLYSWYMNLKNPLIVDAEWRSRTQVVMLRWVDENKYNDIKSFYSKFDDEEKDRLNRWMIDCHLKNENYVNLLRMYFPEYSEEELFRKFIRDGDTDYAHELFYVVSSNYDDGLFRHLSERNIGGQYLIKDRDWLERHNIKTRENGKYVIWQEVIDGRSLSTNGVIQYALYSWQYDWVIIKNVIDYWWWAKSFVKKFWWSIWDLPTSNLYIWFNSNQFKSIDNKVPTDVSDINFEKVLDSEWDEVAAEITIRTEIFKKWRTVKDIADSYWVPIEVVKKIVTDEWLAAYWMYWNWVINITEIAAKSTWAHELFHAIFDVVDKKTRFNIIEESKKLFGYTDDEANEALANAFSQWFRTWKFDYATTEWLKEAEKNAFFEKVKQFFNSIKEWITWVDAHKREVEQLFNDMVDLKWIPDEWKSVSSAKAIAEYNKELEESANKYFAAMLWKNEWANPNYRDTLHWILEDLTWIPIKSLRDLNSVDKNKLWQAVNTEFTNAQRTTWIFRNEITDITDTINKIEDMNLNDMVSELDWRLGWLIDRTAITEDKLPLFKQALEDLETASSPEAWMEAKGRLLSMANGWNEEIFTLSQLRNIFTNWTQATEYKQMFFPNQNLTEEQTKKYVASINNMIFDWLTIALNNNLVKMWYALPLDSARGIVLWYLTNTLSLSDSFAKAFLYKNGLPDSLSVLESIVKSAMPNDLKLWYEEALYKLRDSKPTWEINRIIVQPNPFLPDTYSSIASIVNAKTWNIWVNSESKYLSNILDKYISEVEKWVKEWMTFKQAQQLKTQVWYALDIFEQDIVMSKYWKFLTPEQKSSIRNLKSYLPIVVWKEWDVDMWKQLQALRDVCNDVSSSFTKNIEDVVGKYTTLKQTLAKWDSKAIEKLNEKLKEDWTVMANVDWEVVIIDARTNIKNLLNDMPQSVKWLGWLWWITDEILDWMDNRSIYFLNTLLESIKKLDALSKWEPAIMYHIDPELNMVRFFDTYRLVDNWIWERIPYALVWNVLEWNSDLAKLNLSWLDSILKTDIFKKVKSKFQVDWTIDMDWLEELINSSIDSNSDKVLEALRSWWIKDIEKYKQLIFNEYQKIFTPYTHLKDIPSWWAEFWLQWTKEKINEILAWEIWKVREALEWLPDRYGQTLNNISVESPTWEVISLQQFLDWQSPSWKKAIFDDENILVKSQDDLLKEIATSTDDKEIKKVEAANRKYKREAVNQYNEVLQTIMNQGTLVSDAERKLTSRMLNNARSTAMKYTLTKRLVDASNMVWWLEEEAARMVKYWLVWFWANMTFWKFFTKDVLKRLKDTQDAYRKFYTQSLEDINNIVPKNEAEELAVHLCKYFKTIENYLGSADWLTWVTTDAAVNKAFYNIWETFLNIDTVKWVFALMSAIEENQLLKFFKFSKPRQASYVEAFTRPATLATEDMVWGYREYITKMPDNIDRDTFNRLFASNFTETEFKTLYQALAWVTYVWWWWKVFNQLLNLANGTSFLWRFLVSYPWQLLTVPQQGIGYFIKMRWYENTEWITDYQTIDRVRSKYWTLDKAYNEINAFNWLSPDDINTNSYYNRYWVPDIDDVYKKAWILTTDDVNDIYAKIGNYQSTWDNTWKLMRSMDAYKDNANNLIDWTFARNFKNIAFLKAIRENAFMQFGTVEAFEEFMTNNQVSKQVKQQLMDAVNAAAWRTFRNILWLWFGWLDRAIWWYWISNIFYWLMQFLNFRWAWWQNIFRQTWETFISAIKMAKMWFSKEWRDNIALYLSRNPEFINFTQTLFNDMLWSFKMLRYQDNWRWSELENENDALDYLWYTMELLPMASQWFQWIQSFWPLRPFYEQWVSIARSLQNPEVYRDTYWLWAFFNALGKNAWRNWKPRNWVFQAIQALEEWWESWFMSFAQNEFWKLSFWSLRYMMDDEASKYWYTYDLLSDDWWIPSFFRWESAIDSDKSFSFELSNNNTWDAITQFFNYDNTWDDRKTYLWDWWWAVINGSNLWWTTKNMVKAIPWYGTWFDSLLWKRINPFTMDSFTDVIEWTSAWKELLRTWKVTPKTALEMKSFVEEYVDAWETNTNRSNLKPYGSNFAKAINNYNQFWHVNWIEAHSEDEELEFMLEQIRYERLENWNFKEVNWKRQETQFWKDMVQYIHDHPTDMETTSRLISKDVFDWIELNNDNPNYLLFQSLVWQWMVDWYLDDAWVRFQDDWNTAHWVTKKSKADEKLSKTDWINSGLYWWDFMEYLLNTNVVWTDKPLVEYLQDLDRRNTMSASIKIIKNQMVDENDKKILEKFVKFNVDSYGNEYVTIDSQYASQLRSMWWIWDAIEKWDVNLLMARASQFANQYMNPEDDPTGLVTAYTVNSLVQRVRNAQISPDLKIKMIAALSEKNIEFMQKNLPVLREAMWDELADAVTRLWNQLLFEEDWAVQAAIWDALANWDWDAAKAWGKVSNNIKNCMSSYTSPDDSYWASWNWYGWRSSGTIAKWVPFTVDVAKLLDATWGKWYSPKNPDINVKTYNPKIDLSIGKDINRKKKAFNTQEVKKKKVVL